MTELHNKVSSKTLRFYDQRVLIRCSIFSFIFVKRNMLLIPSNPPNKYGRQTLRLVPLVFFMVVVEDCYYNINILFWLLRIKCLRALHNVVSYNTVYGQNILWLSRYLGQFIRNIYERCRCNRCMLLFFTKHYNI